MAKIEIYEDGKLLNIDPIAVIAVLKPELVEHGTAFGFFVTENAGILKEKFWSDLPYNLYCAMPHILEIRRLAEVAIVE